jgi:serine/threonine protein kinase
VLEKLLGYGGSSAVFLAQQINPARKVAVKVFLPRTPMDIHMQREFYTRFLHEAEAASHLEHPNILPIYSYGEQEGIPYIIMPYMEGGTLSKYIAKRGPLALDEVQYYLEQTASALDFAHQQGFVHCDVKPANMLLDTYGHAMLSDFGIACMADTRLEDNESKSSVAVMGTPDYISPEQALGKPLDRRSDIYSLGVMLFYLLTGKLPFKAESTIALALMHIHEKPPSLLTLRNDLPAEVDNVVQRALKKSPAARFPSAGELSDAFANALAPATQELPVQVRLSLTDTRYTKALRRPKFVALLSGIAVIAILFASGTLAWLWQGSKPGLSSSISNSINNPQVDLLTQRANWPTSSTFFYDAQSYHILNRSAEHVAMALYDGQHFHNLRLHVNMAPVKQTGQAYYGVVLRCAPDQSSYYLFEVSATQYVFLRYERSQVYYLASGRIPNASDKEQDLQIEAHDSTFSYQINSQKFDPVVDKQAPVRNEGQIGLYVEDQGMEVAFSHLYINELP